MASHKINGLLKYGLPILLSFLLIVSVMGKFHHANNKNSS
jgi:hypothetical protein